ncbi:MAG TPA: ABC transporter substrate-binding protein [Methylomirabilota bacterium]|jgi:iron(III) transport system substrate-binding protein|nr:ABC transporter substrate-binding protein [Methylomirabilota bacterium]
MRGDRHRISGRGPVLARVAALVVALVAPAAGGAAPAGKLVLYTSQPDRDAAQTVQGFRAHAPQVEVEVFRSGTTEVLNKLLAEFAAGGPRPDVLLIADAGSMERLHAEGRLLPYPGADVAQLPPGTVNRERTYFGTKLITTGIAYHAAAARKPTSWKDLLAPEARGQVVLPSPLYSGAAAIHMAALLASPALGPHYYEELARNQAVAVRGNGAVASAVAGGQKMYGVLVDFMALNAKAKGSPIDFVFPAEGVTAVTEPVAILRTARNVEAARAFVDFLLSRDGQALATRQGYLPARRDVAPPPGFPPLAAIRILPVDFADFLAHDEANKRRFAELFGG